MSATPHLHLAFGEVISSEVPLPLLATTTEQPGKDSVRLVLHDDLVHPPGEPIGGGDETTMTLFRDGESVLIALNQIGWVARLTPPTRSISLHVDARVEDMSIAEQARSGRGLGDRLVTSVLPYLPQLGNSFAMHGSALETGGGVVLLVAPSGYGKTTLSQVLHRDFGWTILDDDTSEVVERNGAFFLKPMGARSRLRSDAAEYLGLDIEVLAGYSGKKGPVTAQDSAQPAPSFGKLLATITLKTSLEPQHFPAGPAANRAGPIDALRDLFEGIFCLRQDQAETISAQFSLAARLTAVPNWTLTYSKGIDTPEETARVLAESVSLLLG